MTPMFTAKNEWYGDLQEQRPSEGQPPIKKAKYVCLYFKPKNDFFVFLGYGSDCVVFIPTFDSVILSYLP